MPIARSRDRARGHGGAVVVPATPFSPNTLTPFAWYRADLGVTLNGSNISAWADQSVNGKNASESTGANQAPFTASSSAFGNLPIMATGASTKGVQAATASDWTFMHNGAGMTLAVVGRTRGAAGNFMIGTQSSAGVLVLGVSLIPWVSNNVRFCVGNGAGANIDITSGANTYGSAAGHVLVVTYRSGTNPDAVMRIDRVEAVTGSEVAAVGTGAPTGPLSIGYPTNKGGGCDSDFAEVVVWNRVLTGSEITQYEDYVLSRFGV